MLVKAGCVGAEKGRKWSRMLLAYEGYDRQRLMTQQDQWPA